MGQPLSGFVNDWRTETRGAVIRVHQGDESEYSRYEIAKLRDVAVAPSAPMRPRGQVPAPAWKGGASSSSNSAALSSWQPNRGAQAQLKSHQGFAVDYTPLEREGPKAQMQRAMFES